MDVNIPFNPSVTPPKVQSANTQSQQQSGEGNKKQFDPEQLKEEKLVQNASREFSDVASDSSESIKAADIRAEPSSGNAGSAGKLDSAEWGRTEGAPNWSTLSAASKGYTQSERAINLYRHINAMAL